MNSSALESRDLGLEITTLNILFDFGHCKLKLPSKCSHGYQSVEKVKAFPERGEVVKKLSSKNCKIVTDMFQIC